MTTTRCCSRCRTPFQICGDKACKCHGEPISDYGAKIIQLRPES